MESRFLRWMPHLEIWSRALFSLNNNPTLSTGREFKHVPEPDDDDDDDDGVVSSKSRASPQSWPSLASDVSNWEIDPLQVGVLAPHLPEDIQKKWLDKLECNAG